MTSPPNPHTHGLDGGSLRFRVRKPFGFLNRFLRRCYPAPKLMPSRNLSYLYFSRFPIRVVSSGSSTLGFLAISMKQKRQTAAGLAKQLGISRVSLWRLRRQFPAECPATDDIEAWRQFCSAHGDRAGTGLQARPLIR